MGFWVEILRRSMYLEIKKAEIIFSLNVFRNYCHRNHLIHIVKKMVKNRLIIDILNL